MCKGQTFGNNVNESAVNWTYLWKDSLITSSPLTTFLLSDLVEEDEVENMDELLLFNYISHY